MGEEGESMKEELFLVVCSSGCISVIDCREVVAKLLANVPSKESNNCSLVYYNSSSYGSGYSYRVFTFPALKEISKAEIKVLLTEKE